MLFFYHSKGIMRREISNEPCQYETLFFLNFLFVSFLMTVCECNMLLKGIILRELSNEPCH